MKLLHRQRRRAGRGTGPLVNGAGFDGFAESYREAVQASISFIGRDVEYFVALKARHLVDLARSHLGDPLGLRVLDVGCGVGATDRHLAGQVGELHGVDIAAPLVERAAADLPQAHFHVYDGTRLPFASGSFDVAFCICVLHHVPESARAPFAAELARVVRPGGLGVAFEHNPLNPLTRLAVDRCAFDARARLLPRAETTRLLRGAGLHVLERPYIVFLPFGGRRVQRLERRLGPLPLGAQYLVAARKPGR